MARDRTVTLRIPEALLAQALRAARAEEISGAEFIRAALAERLAALGGAPRCDPVSLVRRALKRHFSSAADWLDLQSRLRFEGFVLRQAAGEVWLMSWPVERRLVPLARLGWSLEDLTLAFRAPFPAYGSASGPAPSRRAEGRRAA